MKKKVLIILIIVLVLIVGGLGYYKYFILNKKEVVSKVNLSDTEMSKILDNFSYQTFIENKDVELKDLSKEQIMYIGYIGLNEDQISKGNSEGCSISDNEIVAKCIAKNLGLSDEVINNMDTSLWSNSLGGSTEYQMITPEAVSSVIETKLGLTNQFSESFSNNIGIYCVSLSFIYDKNINMFFVHEESGCSLDNLKYVVNVNSGYKENDIYKINFTEGIFDSSKSLEESDKNYDLYPRSNPTTIIETAIPSITALDAMKTIVNEHKSELDNYEITFKKVNNNYQFVSLDYISS